MNNLGKRSVYGNVKPLHPRRRHDDRKGVTPAGGFWLAYLLLLVAFGLMVAYGI